MDEKPTRDRPVTMPRPGGCTGGWVAAADGAPAAGLAGQVDAGTERPAADLREAPGGSAARAVDATVAGLGSSARSCHRPAYQLPAARNWSTTLCGMRPRGETLIFFALAHART